jgi:hypothetical protein
MLQPSILSVLRERAGLQPDDVAFAYTDYEGDWGTTNGKIRRSACVEAYGRELFARLDV